MAFNMKRPVIKGTPLHKASIAKAKSESIVAQTRTTPSSSLIAASEVLGRSYVPEAQDYKLKSYDLSNIKGKKKKVEEDVAPYVEEAEDDDDDYSEIENDNSDPTDSSTTTKKEPYKNWKVKEEERNIAYAEALKARTDAASAKRVKEKAEAKKNNTNMDWSIEPPIDIEMPAVEPFKPNPNPKSNIKVASKKLMDYNNFATSQGFDMSTEEGRKQAKAKLIYREANLLSSDPELREGGWQNPQGTIEEVTSQTEEEQKALRARKNKVSFEQYGVEPTDLIDDGKGGFTPREGALSKYNETWDAKAGGFRDDGDEQYFGPSGQKISKEKAIEYGDKKEVKQLEKNKKKKVLEAKNLKIRERNKIKDAAREYYGTDALTKKQLEAYDEKIKQDAIDEEFEQNMEKLEQDDPDIGDMDYDGNSNGVPDYLEVTPEKEIPATEPTLTPMEIREQKMADKKYNNPKTSEYIKSQMLKEGYKPSEGKSPMDMRDDRIYQFANKDGPVRRNMIKGGYKPQ